MYGKDAKLENLLSNLEGKFGEIIKRVKETRGETAPDLEFLRLFTYLQHRRTEMAVQRLRDAHNAMQTNILGEAIEDRMPTHYELAIQSLKLCMETMEYVKDLKVRIVENVLGAEFVLSDDPAIFANRFAVQKLNDTSFGVSSSGVYFLMPLTPNLAVICYDSQVYTIPDLLRGRVAIARQGDITAINELQYLKAAENIYFQDWSQRGSVREQFNKIKDRRLQTWSELTVLVPDKNGKMVLREKGRAPKRYRVGTREEGKAAGSALVQLAFKQPTPTRWIPQLKFRSKPKTYYNGSAVGHVRQAGWLKAKPRRANYGQEGPRK